MTTSCTPAAAGGRRPVKFWVAAVVFLGIAAAAGSTVAGWLSGRGAAAPAAVGLGATAGAFSAWLVYAAAARCARSFRRPAEADPGAAADRRPGGDS